MNYIQEILDIEELAGLNLASNTEIPAIKLREVLAKMTTYLKAISPLASGTFTLGDANETDIIRTINLPYDVGTSNYRVVVSRLSKGANFNNDNDVFETVKDKNSSSFKLCFREVTGNIQSLDVEWAIYPKN